MDQHILAYKYKKLAGEFFIEIYSLELYVRIRTVNAFSGLENSTPQFNRDLVIPPPCVGKYEWVATLLARTSLLKYYAIPRACSEIDLVSFHVYSSNMWHILHQ